MQTQIPHLTTALTMPYNEIEKRLLEHQAKIDSWFHAQQENSLVPLYSSVDLRNAGYKIAPVDTNLFPAGFNNLNPAFFPLCVQAIRQTLLQYAKDVTRILIIPENHSRNQFYLESLWTLQQFFLKAGCEAFIGSIDPKWPALTTLKTAKGHEIEIHPVRRVGMRLTAGDLDPDLVVLNNDLSSGIPNLLQGLEQPITPTPELGWTHRLKSKHFSFYKQVADEFANMLEIDPWFVQPLFRNCGEVNFMKKEGSECLLQNAYGLFHEIRKKYAEYGIKDDPFIVVKADSGTYGMGVISIRDPEELSSLNRKQRTRMSKTKEGQEIRKVILQEGIYTHETWKESQAVAEPVVYNIGHQVVGGFYRVHNQRSSTENLNAPGMHFEPLAFAECESLPEISERHNRFYTYGGLSRLAVLAAAMEMQWLEGGTQGVTS